MGEWVQINVDRTTIHIECGLYKYPATSEEVCNYLVWFCKSLDVELSQIARLSSPVTNHALCIC